MMDRSFRNVAFFLFITFIFYPLFSRNSLDFFYSCQDKKNDAFRSFLKEQLQDNTLSVHDILMLAAFLYIGHERAQATIHMNYLSLQAQATIWEGWHNVMSTRRNPSKPFSHLINAQEKSDECIQFWNYYPHYCNAAHMYELLLDQLIHHAVISPAALTMLQKIRSHIRSSIVESLADVKAHVGCLFFNAAQQENNRTGIKGISDVWSYFTSAHSLQSFAKADNLNTQLTYEAWKVLEKVQEIGNYTWNTIEKARCQIYEYYYAQLMMLLAELKIAPAQWTAALTIEGATVTLSLPPTLLPSTPFSFLYKELP